MEIYIQSMEIVHFKCFRTLHLDFHTGVNALYGANGTGKSSVYDAFTWLLFGKNSQGNSSFSVKPEGQEGVTPEVTAVLTVDGQTVKLRRVLREKWEKPRGSSKARFAGHTTEFFVDDVPRKESEYKRIIAGYIDEERFRLLTNVYAVARDMHWKDRRALLAELCGLPEDTQLLARAPQFAELAQAAGNRTIDAYKAALTNQRKGIAEGLNALPVRIDECERMAAGLAELPFAQARTQAEALGAEDAQVRADLAKLDGDALTAAAQNERDALQNRIQALETENQAHRRSQDVPTDDKRPALRQAVRDAMAALDRAKAEREALRGQIADAQDRLEQYRIQWKRIRDEPFKGETCPVCGQTLPADKLEQARRSFEREKQARQARLVEDSAPLKARLQELGQQLESNAAAQPMREAAAEAATHALEAYTPPERQPIEDLPGYAARRAELTAQLEQAQQRVDRLRADKGAERAELEARRTAIQAALRQAETVLAKEQQLADARKRVQALREEQRAAAQKVEQLDRMLDLCEEFARFRVQQVEQAVNDRFRLARFRLFREQVNGGLADCCDVMVDGVPYGDLNSAAKVNVGLDIIETLSKQHTVRVPLFVDNAESVTDLMEIGSQVVRLVVSEEDKELRSV